MSKKTIFLEEEWEKMINTAKAKKPNEVCGGIFVKKFRGLDVWLLTIEMGEGSPVRVVSNLEAEELVDRVLSKRADLTLFPWHSHPVQGYSPGDRQSMIKQARHKIYGWIIVGPYEVEVYKLLGKYLLRCPLTLVEGVDYEIRPLDKWGVTDQLKIAAEYENLKQMLRNGG